MSQFDDAPQLSLQLDENAEFTLEDLQTMSEQDLTTGDLDLDSELDLDDLDLEEELDSLDLDDLDDLDDLNLDDDELNLDDLEEELAEIENQQSSESEEEITLDDLNDDDLEDLDLNIPEDVSSESPEESFAVAESAEEVTVPEESFAVEEPAEEVIVPEESFAVEESSQEVESPSESFEVAAEETHDEPEPESSISVDDDLPALETSFAPTSFDENKFQRYQQLKSDMTLLFEGQEMNLSNSSDINQIADNVINLFTQNIEDSMQRLQRIWQSEKEVKELYIKLEQYSKERAPVTEIISTAQKIEEASGILDSDDLQAEDMATIVNKLQSFKAIIERYEHIFSKLSH